MACLQQSTVTGFRFGRDGSGSVLSAAFGSAALYGTAACSVGVGYCAGVYNNGRSAFVGARAGRFNYSNDNVAVGYGTMPSSSGRCGTVAVGSRAHNSSAGGRFNQAVGAFALESGANGCLSAAVGYQAARCSTSHAMVAIGAYAHCLNVCHANIVVGHKAARSGTACGDSVIFGHCASESTSYLSTVIVGANTYVTGNYHTVWGGASNNACNCTWQNWSTFSDARDKTDISSLTDNSGLDFIDRLRPVSFNLDLRAQYVSECGFTYGQKDGTLASEKKSYGFIAQEVKEVMDDLGIEFAGVGYTEVQDIYNITEEEFIAPLTKAIQKLDERTQSLKTKVGTI